MSIYCIISNKKTLLVDLFVSDKNAPLGKYGKPCYNKRECDYRDAVCEGGKCTCAQDSHFHNKSAGCVRNDLKGLDGNCTVNADCNGYDKGNTNDNLTDWR